MSALLFLFLCASTTTFIAIPIPINIKSPVAANDKIVAINPIANPPITAFALMPYRVTVAMAGPIRPAGMVNAYTLERYLNDFCDLSRVDNVNSEAGELKSAGIKIDAAMYTAIIVNAIIYVIGRLLLHQNLINYILLLYAKTNLFNCQFCGVLFS